MSQKVTLRAKGLHTFENQLGAVPEGALDQADNVIINRDETIESIRGFFVYGTAMGASPTADVSKQLLLYKGKILRHFSTTLQYDNGSGTFTSFSGSYSETESGLRIKYVEVNGNLYFTTEAGIKKISSIPGNIQAGDISNAGGVKALDNILSINTDPGFLLRDSKVAYRVVWGIKDNNQNLILGSPSSIGVISNTVEFSLTNDFNNLLIALDVVGALGLPNLTDTNYASLLTLPDGSAATAIRTNLSSLASKLNTDVIDATFLTIKTAIDALTFSSTPTSAQLQALADQFDAIINQLNADIGTLITSMAAPFNTSSESATVDLEVTIPQEITTAHFYQIYRTAIVTSTGVTNLSDLDPGDEMGLVYEANPTSGDLSSGFVLVHDITPESFRGANLYTNPNSGEGIAQANEPPVKSKDITLFKNYTFYANTQTLYKKAMSLLSISDLVPGVSTLTISNGVFSNTYTFDLVEDIPTKKIKITPSTVDPTITPSQQVDETSRSLVHVINRDTSEILYAYYLSGPTDVPGMLNFENKVSETLPFYFTVNNSATGGQFNPSLPTSGTSVSADNEVSPNRIYYSKFSQPEAVPLLNYFDVGPKDKKIVRIIGLRESLFVFKEDSIYRVSGDLAPFVVAQADSSTIITAADTAHVLNNQIYILSDQGVATITDGSVNIISRPIENSLLKLNTPNYPNYKTASFGIGYESDRTYYLWTVTNKGDTQATQCFRYNTFTGCWTRSVQTKTCAIVNSTDDKLYLGAGDLNYIEKERKSFDRTDFAHREYNFTLTPSDVVGDVIQLSSIANVTARDVLVQVQLLSIEQYNDILSKLDLDFGTSGGYVAALTLSAGANMSTAVTALATKLDADTKITAHNYVSSISGAPTPQAAFNIIVNKLNVDSELSYNDYFLSSGSVQYETIILSVDTINNRVTVGDVFPFIAGTVTTYQHIECTVRWTPQTFGDTSIMKQVREGTLIFEKVAFSDVTLGFSTDLSPGYEDISFTGSGNGNFGEGIYGENPYGGESNSIPFRTYVPLEKQRCRYMNVRFKHFTARENFSVFGLSLTSNPISERGYK